MIEQAKLNATTFEIEDCDSNMYISHMPYMQATPVIKTLPRPDNNYFCPVYKAYNRQGVLQSNGTTSNFVGTVSLQLNKDSRVGPE